VDILYLLDQLEEVLGTGSKLPFTSRTLVDEQEVLDILDQIRMSIPEELKAARRLSQERDQVLADARAEADRIIREAEEHAAGRISEHSLVRSAESRASEIEDRAKDEAQQVRQEAEAYAYRVLERLHEQINQLGQTVERGLRELSVSHTHRPPDGV
jgi:cell division septum initiation protein DivIVA